MDTGIEGVPVAPGKTPGTAPMPMTEAPLAVYAMCKAACRTQGRPGIFVAFDGDLGADVAKASDGLIDPARDTDMCIDGQGFAWAEDEDEAWALYDRIVDNDGPTRANPYTGPAGIYAMIIDADGQTMTENT